MFHIKSTSDYHQQYQLALDNPEQFWGDIASHYVWFEKWKQVMDCDLSKGAIQWYLGGKTNMSYNCLDRHLDRYADKTAIVFEPNNPGDQTQKISYRELFNQTCQFAQFLTAQGVQRGDRVCIYMPMIPQAIVAMLACTRIGAVHCVVFAGFSEKSLAGRINDCGAKILITSDLLFRGEKTINLLDIVKETLHHCDTVASVVIYQRSKDTTAAQLPSRVKTIIWQNEVGQYPHEQTATAMDAEDPLFILYTSGSTGQPKGLLHTTGGYMTYTGYSFRNVFQFAEDDIFFCSADIGWITGHSYLVYGPLLNAATVLMFEGVPTYPDASRFWKIIEKHRVNIFYTSPTAIRTLLQKGDGFVEGHDLSSLKILGTVGEPINEEAWEWYAEKVGQNKCPICDTWWQTETGGIMLSSLGGITESKAAYTGRPLPGIVPILLNDQGQEITQPDEQGNLCFRQGWPSMARTIYGDHNKYLDTYYNRYRGNYFSGDGAFRDADGLYRVTGRIDDMLNVSGHLLGTAEIENAIDSHEEVSEAAVIGIPHDIKGETIVAFVIAKHTPTKPNLEDEIVELVRKNIGPIAKPEKIYVVPGLPRTRSGKIMRRVLKKIITKQKDLGDTSTLANPDIVTQLTALFAHTQ